MNRQFRKNRKGAVSVEFALLAPVFVVLLLGLWQASDLLEIQNQFSTAAREGARLAGLEREGLIQEGQSINNKVVQDIRNFLNANGLPGNDVDIYIADAADKDVPFDLGDPANDLKLFQIRIEYSTDDLLMIPLPGTEDFAVAAKVVFRNGRATLTQ